MKKICYIVLTVLLCFSFTPLAFAMDEPVVPSIEGLTVKEANGLIATYNDQAKEYNDWVKEENERIINEHVAMVEEVEAWNDAEDAKVEENEAALAAQHEYHETILADNERVALHRTYDETELPEDAVNLNPENTNLYTVSGEKTGAPYKFLVRYIYWGGENSDEFLMGEWFTGAAYEGETVVVDSESVLFGAQSWSFNRKLKGYTKGYWGIGWTELEGNLNTSEGAVWQQTWSAFNEKGESLVILTFNYVFFRTGEDPAPVEQYIPQYKDYKSKPDLLIPVKYMSYITEDIEIVKENLDLELEDLPDRPHDTLIPGLGDEITFAGIGIIIAILAGIIIFVARRKMIQENIE